MTTAITIRLTRAEDAAYLPAVEISAGEAFRTVPGLEWIADGDDILSVEQHTQYIDQGAAWVAETKGQCVGFVAAECNAEENCLHIWELSVESDYQGKGVGRKLLDAAREYALDKGLLAITLTTFRELVFNEGFYQKLGYRTLTENELSQRLNNILTGEAESGLPRERRCAMELRL